MGSPLFFEKELSWLSFNERVLQEAADPSVPIIERVRFLGIYSSNLNEFFRVRVADVRRKAIVAQAQHELPNLYELKLVEILDKITVLTEKFQVVSDRVFAELTRHHIRILFNYPHLDTFASQLTDEQRQWLKNYFDNRIIRHITPIILSSKTMLANCLEDESSYFLVALHQRDSVLYALVEIPRQEVARFIVLPTKGSKKEKVLVLLDDVIQFYIDDIFNGFFDYSSIEAFSIRLTRDAEYNLTDELDKSLLDKMSKGLKQRLNAEPVRLVYDQQMPEDMKSFLSKSLKIKQLDNLVPGIRYRHFKDFINFPNLGRKHLEKPKMLALESQRFQGYKSVFSAICHQDILLYYPYHKFRHFTEFVRQAAYDPSVEHIKINIYRVAKNSRIINSLIDAVKNGKKVTVVVELRARFDEQTNIDWAKIMKDAGIDVVFGIDTLKIHSKLCLIIRNEAAGLVKYAHIGTGNFHENNARIYTDFSLFTCHKEICQEVDDVFTFISYSYKKFTFNHLIISPLTSRQRFYQLIDQEITNALSGKAAAITIKVNNLVDEGLIARLYKASNAGVKIRLIVRGMCSLIPGMKGMSDNIKAISIVDQLLEHPRVMVFHNDNNTLVYIGSADWMSRNLDNRVEVACPIYDDILKQRIIKILDLQFSDTTKARVINQLQDNQYVVRGNRRKIRSQAVIYDYLAQEERKDQQLSRQNTQQQSDVDGHISR